MTDTLVTGPAEVSTADIPVNGEAAVALDTAVPTPVDLGWTRTRDKVVILGFAPHWVEAPFNDPSWEIWGINQMYKQAPRLDVLFEMHPPGNLAQEEAPHIQWLQNQRNIPVYMPQHYPQYPMSVRYPIEHMVREYGTYFTSSLAYMIALAIEMGYPEIGIFGVDMAQDSEYKEQRAGCELLIGMALGKGRKVYMPPGTDLLKTAELYGYHEDAPYRVKLRSRLAWLQGQHAQASTNLIVMERNLENQKIGVAQIQGAIDDCSYQLRSFAWNAPVQADGSPVPTAGG